MSSTVKVHGKAPLPMRDGVTPSYLWLPEGDWPDLLAFMVANYPAVTEAQWRERMARGDVVDAQGTPLRPDSPYKRQLRIFYYRELDYEAPIPFAEEILYQDEHIVVADKPHFLPTIPTGRFLKETLLVRLRAKLGIEDLVPIHRLDRETAGIVVFSSNLDSRGAYQSLFQKRLVQKEYEALAGPLPGRTFPFSYKSRMVQGDKFFTMKEEEGEPNSETMLDVIEQRGEHVLYRLWPHTGRQHQLRVHLAALGIPIVNDAFYPVALPCKQDDVSSPLKLLARSLGFPDPLTGEWRQFESRRSL
ncbi:tRNA pseudouridine32 synthase / 23S rRNA pseudouridine746 synthase [Pseudoduganella lurida]|uniref:tRNA pseudouridine32 synthase / 23S rRNA pseudouridine746 synthase n=1 Tax=Pseudoduganella lurida TaxID=1036180 RepID=A0A562R3S7_9BURK|nr:pseudouridine synthase [Pseudoduganella lurida]TWI63717.1 tRNA pseudouridine32 synthase / 23S rRNA pseudouridine746 synthase [Pseudoduganella lurida]